jgi:hypothetical protein
MKMIARWIRDQGIDGFLFTYNETPVKKEFREKRFRLGLENAGVFIGERKLVPYSLRYPFRSRTHGILDADAIRSMMNHRSQEINDHYLQFNPEQKKIDEAWG